MNSIIRIFILSNFRSITLAVMVLTALAIPGFAATYYIDYVAGSDTNAGTDMSTPWQRVPGMTGFTGAYTHTAGDVFIFKGGVTWPKNNYPWTVTDGGQSGTPDTYTTNTAWFSGSSFSQPIFDDGASHPGMVGMMSAQHVGYLTFSNLSFTNCGQSQVGDTDKCLVFLDTHDITLTNNTFTTYCWISVFCVFDDGASHSNFTFMGNDFSHTSGAVWFASGAANTTEHIINYNNNVFHDYSSQIGGGVHADGALHFFVIPSADATQYADSFVFCNNRFYGDFRQSFPTGGGSTGLFFVEAGLSGIICNNDFSFYPVEASMFEGLIVLYGDSNPRSTGVQIYNNSLANIGTNAMSAGIEITSDYQHVTVENNIAYGMQYAVGVDDPTGTGATLISDYNIWNSSSAQLFYGVFDSYAQWQSAGLDKHGILGVDPAWVAAPGNERLAANSPAIGTGVNLSSLNIPVLKTDILGNPRPATGAWDIGAYQFPRNGPSPPTSLTTTSH